MTVHIRVRIDSMDSAVAIIYDSEAPDRQFDVLQLPKDEFTRAAKEWLGKELVEATLVEKPIVTQEEQVAEDQAPRCACCDTESRSLHKIPGSRRLCNNCIEHTLAARQS